jgi:hypothetical protein
VQGSVKTRDVVIGFDITGTGGVLEAVDDAFNATVPINVAS